jgi:hypothetical protein
MAEPCAEPFYIEPGMYFRFVHASVGDASHCPYPVVRPGQFVERKVKQWRVGACREQTEELIGEPFPVGAELLENADLEGLLSHLEASLGPNPSDKKIVEDMMVGTSTWSSVLGAPDSTVGTRQRPVDGHLSSEEEVPVQRIITYPRGQLAIGCLASIRPRLRAVMASRPI